VGKTVRQRLAAGERTLVYVSGGGKPDGPDNPVKQCDDGRFDEYRKVVGGGRGVNGP